MAQPVFKPYSQYQASLLPPSLEELIESHHPVRVVNTVIEGIDLKPLLRQYKGGGTSSYHPSMLLKVVVYCYLTNIYSSRRMEAALKENIHLMWLSGMSRPDHNTLNRFRCERLKEVLKDIFVQVVHLLAEQGLLSLKEQYVDGTKLESASNRYTFVWGNAIKTSREKMSQQLDALWSEVLEIAAGETDLPEPPPFAPVDPEQMRQTIDQLSAVVSQSEAGGKKVSARLKQKLSYCRRQWPQTLTRYAAQEEMLGGRNSCSKTDPDATFMRMKEDHMKNGQLKPAYNLQISTNSQFIVHYSLHQSPVDTTTLPVHLEEQKALYKEVPAVLVADAGYGSEQNYQYLEDQGIEGYVKYGYFDREQKKPRYDKKPFAPEKLFYNAQQDVYYCPMGQPMTRIADRIQKTANGYSQTLSRYQACNCAGCPLRGVCHGCRGNRVVEVNRNLNRLKVVVKQRLESEEGIARRKRRCWEVEPVFAGIKSNHGFRRFMLRGLEKVSIEAGLLALAHNLRKKAA